MSIDGEKIRRVIEPGDQRELVLEGLAYTVGNAVGIALGGALPGEMDERILRGGEAGDGLLGIFVAQFVEREGRRLVERAGLRDRFRRVVKEARHLVGRLEKAFGIDGEPAAGCVDRQVLADAGEHVLQFAAVGMMIEHVVDGDERYAGLARPALRCASRRAVVAAIEHAAASRTRPGAAARKETRACASFSGLHGDELHLAPDLLPPPPPLAGGGEGRGRTVFAVPPATSPRGGGKLSGRPITSR